MDLINLEQRDDPAARYPGSERTGLEEIRINLRLSWQGLIGQRIGAAFAIKSDNLFPVLCGHRLGKHGHIWIPDRFVERGLPIYAQS
jgi:hypothetical protein